MALLSRRLSISKPVVLEMMGQISSVHQSLEARLPLRFLAWLDGSSLKTQMAFIANNEADILAAFGA